MRRTRLFLLTFFTCFQFPIAHAFNEPEWISRLMSPASEKEALQELEHLAAGDRHALAVSLGQMVRNDAVSARKAAGALAKLGRDGEPAVSDLAAALRYDDESAAQAAVEALAAIGVGSLNAVEKRLSDGNFFVRRRAATVIAKIGPSARRSAKDLVPLLRDTQPEVREAAEGALAAIGEGAIPALTTAFRKGKENERQALIEFLPRMGAPGAPVLIDVLRTSTLPHFRVSAAAGLGKIHTGAASVSALVEALKDLDDGVRSVAAEGLGEFGDAAKEAIGPLLIASQTDKEGTVRRKAEGALHKIGGPAQESLAGLIPAIGHKHDDVRMAAVTLLAESKISAQDSIPLYMRALRDARVDIRRKAVDAAAKQAHHHAVGLPVFAQALRDTDAAVRGKAISELGALKEQKEEAAEALASLMATMTPANRREVVRALDKLSPAGIPGLIQALGDGMSPIRDAAAEALVRHGAPAREALERTAAGSDPELAKRASAVLKRFGPARRKKTARG